MKTLKQILVVMMMVLMTVSSFEAEAQSRKSKKSNRTKARTTKTVAPTPSEIIEGIGMLAKQMSSQCPMDFNDGLGILESVSFKNKCFSMTYSLTDKYEDLVGTYMNSDYSYLDYHVKLTISRMIKAIGVSANTFAKTGISFHITFKDNYGDVLWDGRVTPNEYVAFYNELTKNGGVPSKNQTFNLESFRQMVKSWDASTPQDLGDGITLVRVSMNGTNIYYDATTPYSFVMIYELLDEEEEEEVREEVAKELYDLYHALDSKKDTILDNMIKLGITINYRYYAGSDDIPYRTISLPASYIKRVGSKRR